MGRRFSRVNCRRVRMAACGLLWAAITLVGSVHARAAESDPGDQFYAHLYVAQWSRTRFNQIIRLKTDRDDSWQASMAVGRPFRKMNDNSDLEWEIQIAKHWGLQDHPEVAAAISARRKEFPWDHLFRNTLAFGVGLSYAFDVAAIEEQGDDESTYLLVQLLAEATIAPPGRSQWSLFMRASHRSGAFGLVADSGSSNFVGVGLRRHF